MTQGMKERAMGQLTIVLNHGLTYCIFEMLEQFINHFDYKICSLGRIFL